MYEIDLFEREHDHVIVMEATVQVNILAIKHNTVAPER